MRASPWSLAFNPLNSVSLAFFIFLLLSPGVAEASCLDESKSDVPCWAQIAYVGIALIDMSQTRWHQAHGHGENNPLTPSDPAGINASMVLQAAVVIGLSELLPSPWGGYFLFIRLGANAESVYYNARIGVQATW